jgi:magnesium and cobalt transporter
MSEDSSQSLFSKLKNLVNLNSQPKLDSGQPNDEQIQELIENVLKIKGTVVKEIMIPEVNISSLNETQNLQEIISVLNETRHSRYPVYDGNNAKVIGILHVKDLIEIIGSSNDEFNINELIREVKIVPETKSVTSMLEDFKKDRAHLAMVIDEYGMLVGLITIEDILEELVGEIEDEHDQSDVEIVELSNNKYSADAKVELDVFNEYFELNLDVLSIDAETIGGFVIDKLGILPKVGDSLEINNLTLKVVDADPRKLKKLLIIKNN